MNLIVKSRNGDVPSDVRAYAEEKVGKVGKILNSFLMEAEVELFAERNPAIENGKVAEVTIRTKGPVIRARESALRIPPRSTWRRPRSSARRARFTTSS